MNNARSTIAGHKLRDVNAILLELVAKSGMETFTEGGLLKCK